MKIELSGNEKAIILVYLNSFQQHYKKVKNKHVAKAFDKVKSKFMINSDKIDVKRGDWSFIVRALLEGKRLILTNMPDVDNIENEEERKETKESMNHAVESINSALKKIQKGI